MNLFLQRVPPLYETIFSEFFDTWQQSEKGWKAEIELPGFDPSEVEVEALDWEVRVRAKQGQKTKNYTLTVPTQGTIVANMKNGLLVLTLVTENKNKKIEITSD
jgi:HSP20 family molecular chaperone IbpA